MMLKGKREPTELFALSRAPTAAVPLRVANPPVEEPDAQGAVREA
jgi:hypothetical protein